MGSKARGWWQDVWDCAAVSMVICWDSFSDGLHHPHPGVCLCVPPRGPAHLHRAAQVCSYDRKTPAKFWTTNQLHNIEEGSYVSFVLG